MAQTSPPEEQHPVSPNFRKAVDYLKSGGDLFLTGAGGTGKSYLTRKIIQEFKNPIVLGTTGLAAVNIGGETMHSFFRLGINRTLEDLKTSDELYLNSRAMPLATARRVVFSKLEQVLGLADIIILDEVSMATGEQLEMMLYRIHSLTGGRRTIPFLFVGDLLQLPPVGTNTPIFLSPFWKAKMWTLKKVHRTTDKDFYRIQRKVRWGIVDPEVLDFIEARVVPKAIGNKITLAARNSTVDMYNSEALEKISTELEEYVMTVDAIPTIRQQAIDKFVKDLTPPKILGLKVGARVMVTNNVYKIDEITEEKVLVYYNGQVGTYVGADSDLFGDTALEIRTDEGKTIFVTKYEYEKVTHKVGAGQLTKVVEIVATQYPIRLAYALTIHKSQGQTLNAIHINCRNIENPGQFYVAFSRCSNSENLSFSHFYAPAHIKADERCKQFYQKA